MSRSFFYASLTIFWLAIGHSLGECFEFFVYVWWGRKRRREEKSTEKQQEQRKKKTRNKTRHETSTSFFKGSVRFPFILSDWWHLSSDFSAIWYVPEHEWMHIWFPWHFSSFPFFLKKMKKNPAQRQNDLVAAQTGTPVIFNDIATGSYVCHCSFRSFLFDKQIGEGSLTNNSGRCRWRTNRGRGGIDEQTQGSVAMKRHDDNKTLRLPTLLSVLSSRDVLCIARLDITVGPMEYSLSA